jgi:hypothetical protein
MAKKTTKKKVKGLPSGSLAANIKAGFPHKMAVAGAQNKVNK